MFNPETFSTETFSTETFNPETFSTETFSTETFSTETFSTEMFSTETFSGTDQSRAGRTIGFPAGGVRGRMRRAAPAVGVGVALALTLGLSACRNDQGTVQAASNHRSAVANAAGATTTSLVPSSGDSGGGNAAPPQATGGATRGPGRAAGGGVSAPGQGTGGSGGASVPAPVIDSFSTPDTIDCHNGNFQQFTAGWSTSGARRVTISIDGPGVYAEYPADGQTSLPFSCSSPHSFLLTALGADGRKVTRTITLLPRNVQPDIPDEHEEGAMNVMAKTTGGSTGTGPASEKDCETYALQIDGFTDQALAELDGGDMDTAIATAGKANRVENEGMSLGCFFVYT